MIGRCLLILILDFKFFFSDRIDGLWFVGMLFVWSVEPTLIQLPLLEFVFS